MHTKRGWKESHRIAKLPAIIRRLLHFQSTMRQAIDDIVQREDWITGDVSLFFNVDDNHWQSIVTDVNLETGDMIAPSGSLETIAQIFNVMLPERAIVTNTTIRILRPGESEYAEYPVRCEYKAADGTWHKWGDWDERGAKALDLWRQFLDDIEPYYEDKHSIARCLFCGSQYDCEPHMPDCIYVQAKALFPVEKSEGGNR